MVSAPAHDVVLSTSAQSTIEFHARRLAWRFPFHPSQEADIRAELILCLVQRSGGFDPGRASIPTYVDRVVRSAATGMVRSELRHKRAAGISALSLESTPAGSSDAAACLGEKLGVADHCRRIGSVVRDFVQEVDSADAVSHVLATLPPDLHAIAMHLSHDPRPAVVARQLGLSRSQMESARRRLRRYFGSEDFADFRGHLGRKRRK